MTIDLPLAGGGAMTRILIVDDDPQLLRALRINLTARGYDVAHRRRRRHRAGRRQPHTRPTWSSSTSACPTWTASRSSTGLRGWSTAPIIVLSARDTEAGQGRRPGRRRRRLRHQAVRHGRTARPHPRRAAPRRTRRRRPPVVDHRRVHHRPRRQARHHRRPARSASPRPNGTCSRSSSATPASSSPSSSCCSEVWGPAYETETNYLRVHLANLRRKLEPDPARPRYLITEPGIGYRFTGEPVGRLRRPPPTR